MGALASRWHKTERLSTPTVSGIKGKLTKEMLHFNFQYKPCHEKTIFLKFSLCKKKDEDQL